MTRQLAMEGSEHGIRVNSISPGFIETNSTRGELDDEEFGRRMRDRTLLGRVGKPEDIANMAVSRNNPGGKALMGLSLDTQAAPEVVESLRQGMDDAFVTSV